MTTIDDEERRARIAHRHLLVTRTDDVSAITDALVAVHSSDPATVYLTYWARMVEPSVEAVEHALYEAGELLRHHGMRRTLWVTTVPTARAMHASTTVDHVGPLIRRHQLLLAGQGLADPAAWWADARRTLFDALAEHGPLSARELGRLLPDLTRKVELSPGTPYAAIISMHLRVLTLMGFEGLVTRGRPTGSWLGSEYRWGLMPEGLGIDTLDPRDAASRLAAAYVGRFGPVTTADIAWWTGWTKARTRTALADAGVRETTVGTGQAWVATDDVAPPDPGPWVAVLPSLDATSMGWWDRSWYLPASAWDAFDMTGGIGNAGPTIWVDGRIVGAWAQRKDGELMTHWFERVPAPRRREVADLLEQVRGRLGGRVLNPRFPGRIQPSLLSASAGTGSR